MLWNQLNILEAHPGVWEMEEQGTGVGISNFIQGNKKTAPLTNPWEGLWGDEWEQPCQTDKIRSSVVDTRQCDSAPGEAQTHNPSNSSLAPSGD